MPTNNKLSATAWLLGAVVVGLVFIAYLRPWESSGRQDREKAAQSEKAIQTVTVSIPIEGMSCGSCAASVKRTAKGVEGVRNAEVDLAGRSARVEYVVGRTSPEQISAAIRQLGYKTGMPIVETGK
jgi:copper chaperone CopZ